MDIILSVSSNYKEILGLSVALKGKERVYSPRCTQHCTLGATSKFSSHIKRQQQRFRRFFVLFPTFCIYYASRYKNKKSVAGKEKSYLFPPLIIVIKAFIYKSSGELSLFVRPTIQCVLAIFNQKSTL